MKALQILVLIVFLTFVVDATDYTKLCSLFKINTKLRLPGSCDQYIVCNGSTGQILSCEANSKYDAKEQKCIKNLDTTKLCDNRCLNRNGIWIANPTDCRSFYYCKNAEAFLSSCNPEYHFDQDRQMCVYPRHSQCFHNVNNICELVADKTLFRDENDCSKYYKCEKEKLTKLECKNQYFNVETGRCAEKYTVNQCRVQHPTLDTCLINREPYVGEISDGATCRGYFVCADKGKYAHDLEPVWLQCPPGTFFNQRTLQCLPARDVKCNFNRCDGRGNSRVTSENNNCRNYFECKNNMILREATCQNHYFFDDRLSACVPYIIYDKCCDDASTYPHATY